MITIKQFTDQNVIYCVSTLIDELRKKECLDEETLYELYSGPIDYGSAKYELELEQDYVFKHYDTRDNKYYFGVRNFHGAWKTDPIFNDEEQAITEYYEQYLGGTLEDYRQEIFEHYIVTNWLTDKLEEQNETVVRDVFGLTIWARATTGQSIYMDWVIQEIYKELVSN